jgi:hypothetical protein
MTPTVTTPEVQTVPCELCGMPLTREVVETPLGPQPVLLGACLCDENNEVTR